MRRLAVLVVATVVATLVATGAPRPSLAAADAIHSLSVAGSPFYPNGDGIRESVTLTVRLAQPAQLTVEVVDFDGYTVRTLVSSESRAAGTHFVRWRGRNDAGLRVDDGPYRFRVRALAGGVISNGEALFTKAVKAIFPVRPAAILVAIDPGHGDVYSEPGRVTTDGTREAVINLDIGLRLRAMLEGAGVRTVISRTLDQGANTPEWDRNEDGVIEYADELQARCDFASLARADVFISIHNNFATNTGVGGPSTYYWPERPFADRSYELAKLVQASMLARLDLYRTDTWYPSRSHGVLSHYPYFVLHQASPPRHPRPTFMPGVLSEGVFLTKPYELFLVKQPRVRTSMAAAYYDAIRAYINERPTAVGYHVVEAPATANQGSSVDYRLRLVNKGMDAAAGWRLEARYVPAVTLFDGSENAGELLGSVAVTALARAARTRLDLTLPTPPVGDWLIKFDVVAADGMRLSDRGSPQLQLPLSVSAP